MPVEWIESGGGPLIALPQELEPLWEGAQRPRDGRVVVATFRFGASNAPATDYDRACDVGDCVGVLPVGCGWALVLGDEPTPTCFVPTPTGGVFVRWLAGRSEVEVEAKLGELPESGYTRETVSLQVISTPVRVFDSARGGNETQGVATFELAPGRYEIESLHWVPDEETSLLLHRLSRVEDAG